MFDINCHCFVSYSRNSVTAVSDQSISWLHIRQWECAWTVTSHYGHFTPLFSRRPISPLLRDRPLINLPDSHPYHALSLKPLNANLESSTGKKRPVAHH